MNKKGLLALLVIPVLLVSCDPFDGDLKTGNRNIVIDVDDTLFNSRGALNTWEQGPGISKIDLSVELKDGSGNAEASLNSTELDPDYDFTQLIVPVVGELISVTATAYLGTEAAYTAVIDSKSDYEDFYGWETFANVLKFKIGFHGDPADWDSGYLDLNICPRGGGGVAFLADSGVTTAPDMLTDWGGTALTSRQIAVQPMLKENPTDMTFDVYTCIVGSDLREEYKIGYGNNEAEYTYYPWSDVWAVAEVTTDGRRIGDETYTLTKYNSDSLSFIEPSGAGSGYDSFLIDLSSVTEPDLVGKYLMFCLVMKYDILSVASSMEIVEIR